MRPHSAGPGRRLTAELLLLLAGGLLLLAAEYFLNPFDRAVRALLAAEGDGLDYVVILGLYLILAAGLFAYRRWREARAEVAERRRAEDALRALRDELEARVAARTADLGQSNTSLQTEMAERRRIQAAHEESSGRFRALFELSPDAIVLIDPHTGGAAWPIIDCNLAACQMNGYARDELIGQSIDILNLAPGTPAERQAYLQQLRGAGTLKLETQHRRKGGALFSVEVSTTLITVGEHELIVGIDRDISERQRAEDILRENEARYHALFEQSPISLWEEDFSLVKVRLEALRQAGVDDFPAYFEAHPGLAGELMALARVVAVNQATLTLFGAASEAEIIQHLPQIVSEGARSMAAPELARIAAGQTRFRYETVNQTLAGRRLDVDLSWAAAAGHESDLSKVIVSLVDVTERKRAEAAFTAERNFLRTVIDNLPDQVFVKDRQGRFVIANPAVVQARQAASEAELLGKSDFELFPRAEAEGFWAEEQAVIHSGQSLANQTVSGSIAPDGTQRWLQVTKVPLRDAHGQVTGLVGLIRNISELKQAEQALRDSEAYYRLTFDSNPLPMWVVDNETLAFLTVNEAAQEHYGYSRAEFLSMTLNDIRPAEDVARLEQFLAGVDPAERRVGGWRHRKRDGTLIDVEVYSHSLPFGGQPARLVLINDITERQQRARELEAIASLSAALRAARARAEMLPIILDQLLSLFAAQAAALDIGDPASGHSLTELGRGLWAGLTGQHTPSGEGITAQVLATGESYLSDDIRTDARFSAEALVTGIRAVACVPLVVDQRNIGALWIGREPPLQPADMRLLKSVADMAANALARAGLHEATERHVRQLASLREIDQAIAASLNLQVSLNLLLETAIQHLGVDAADVLVYLPRLHTLEQVAGRGFRAGGSQKSRQRLSEGPAGRAAQARQAQHLAGAAALGAEFDPARRIAAEGFVEYFGVPLIAKGNVSGVLELFSRQPLDPDANWLEFRSALAGQAAVAIDNIQLFEGLERSNLELAMAYDTTIEGWSRALDLRDHETEGHSQRVTELTLRLAEAVGVGEHERVHIRRGALLHDIGKMGVPDAILLKPGPLTDEEFAQMKQHPQLAHDMLGPIHYLQPALDIPYCHHEKWDGSGYPRGLQGEQIPLAARMFAVADVWDALRSNRSYRPAWPEDKVRAHLRALSGTHFDPSLVEVFLNLV